MRISLQIKMFLVTASIVFLTTLTMVFFTQREIEKTFYSEKNSHAQNLLNAVYYNVENEYKSLLFHKEAVLAKRKSELRNIIDIVISDIDKYHKSYKNGLISEKEAKRLASEEINNMRYDNGVGYIWINDTGRPFPRMIMHPILPELDGVILDDPVFNCTVDTDENLFAASVNVCLHKREGYIQYVWPKPSPEGLTHDQQKLSYVRLYPAWDWIIGTGVYIDDIEKDIKKRQDAVLAELSETFSKIHVSGNGYMFIANGDGEMLIHPDLSRDLDWGETINRATGNPLMVDLFESAKIPDKPLDYIWDKPDHGGEYRFWKRVFVKYFEPLDWYIASTVYNDESTLWIAALRKKVIILSVLFVAVAFLFSSLLSRSLAEPLRKLTSAAGDIDKNGIAAANIPVGGTIETRELGMVLQNLFNSIVKSEKALLDNEKQLRAVVDSSIDAIISVDRQGRIILYNPAAEKMFGYPKEDIIGETIDILIPEKYRETHREYVNRVFSGEISSPVIGRTQEQTARRSDGSILNIELSLSEYLLENNRFVLAVIRDITERKQLETQLFQSQKMESVGRLAGGVAHDFNNLLTVILGNSEMALSDIEPDDPLYPYITEINNTGERAKDLTRQLLAFTRQQVVDPRVVNLNAVIHDMEKMLRRLVNENIDFVTRYDANLWNTKIDPGQVGQIMTNLVVNAWDAMPEGGQISIETRNIAAHEFSRFNYRDAAVTDYVMVSVSDTGGGIDEKIISKVFEPYFTTKANGKGTGLGLSICYGIIKQNNGQVSISSQKNYGTTINIFLPKAAGDIATNDANLVLDELPEGSETVLIAEDDENVRLLVKTWLKKKGYRTVEAENGRQALDIASSLDPRNIGLIVCDVVMPVVGGKELYSQFSNLNPDVKVLFISGHMADSNLLRDIERKHLLLKPFSHSELIQGVHEVLNG